MNRLHLSDYRENKSCRYKRLVWLIVAKLVLPVLSVRGRIAVLRLFGTKIGCWCVLRPSAKIYAPWNLEIGDALIGPRVKLYTKDKIKIGSAVVISQDAYLCTASHDIASPTMDLVTKPIVIEDNVWIAARAVVLPGVTIGEGAVVGACAVVAKDVPPWTVVVGNPARVVGKRELK